MICILRSGFEQVLEVADNQLSVFSMLSGLDKLRQLDAASNLLDVRATARTRTHPAETHTPTHTHVRMADDAIGDLPIAVSAIPDAFSQQDLALHAG